MTNDLKFSLNYLIIYLLVGLFFFVVMIYGSIEKSSFGSIFVVSITFISISIARVLKVTEKYKKMLSISRGIGFVGSINVLIFLALSWIQNSNVKSDSMILIKAIEQYSIDNGQYPENLNSLTPSYIKEIPKVWIGIFQKDFMYHKNGFSTSKTNVLEPISQDRKSHFYFAYNSFFGEIYIYNNIDKTWTEK